MKICIVSRNINADYTGSFEFDQALALKERGHDVYVLSLDFRSIRRKRPIGMHVDVHKGVNVIRCSLPIGPVKLSLAERIEITAFKKAFEAIEKQAGGFDVVNPHFFTIAYICLRAIKEKMKIDVPVAVTEHSSRMNVDFEDISASDAKKAGYVYRNADRVIAVSGALAEKIKQNFGVDCEVVYNV